MVKWFAKKKQKLTQLEIDEAIRKIRSGYDDYLIQYLKTPALKEQFEERYLSALRNRINLDQFIAAEMYALKELSAREEQIIEDRARKDAAKKASIRKKKEPDLADRMLEEFRKRIDPYPSLEIHKNASVEVVKLYGFLSELEKEIWPDLDRMMRQNFRSRGSSPREKLENQLWELSSGNSRFPSVLNRYYSCLISPTVALSTVAAEARACLLKASFFLHDTLAALRELLGMTLSESDQKKCKKYIQLMNQVIYDFRLKDMNPKSLG